ncbi:MAG TPA: hypothetical protein VFP68_04290 [Burkholderiaceae bacterium]|nr:hypothetical protein [Burkholderiaceae bacterium]
MLSGAQLHERWSSPQLVSGGIAIRCAKDLLSLDLVFYDLLRVLNSGFVVNGQSAAGVDILGK